MLKRTKIAAILLAFLVTLSEAEWNTNDYMKREHSLIKPYQGKTKCDKISNGYSGKKLKIDNFIEFYRIRHMS
jgi:hypothetical protein